MGANDGFVIGLKKIVDHGPPTVRWNLVLVAEGFQAAEMPKFHQEASKFVDKLFHTKPFDEMWCAINIYRLDVASTESGADEPSGGECTGNGAVRATYFDATFCSGGVQRRLTVNDSLVLSTVDGLLSDYDEVIVVVNSLTYGGAGGLLGTYSLGFSPKTGKGGVEIAIHELGHSGFQLADEYPYGAGNTYTGSEPFRVNVTKNTDKATIKWGDLIAGSTAVPTKTNPNCAEEDETASPVPPGTVGAFEGADEWHCGLFRPEFTCQMRELGTPFCAVCQRQIRAVLQPSMAPVTVTLVTPSIDFKDIPEGIGGIGVTTYRAAVFEVGSCAPVSLQAQTPTGGFGLPLGGAVVVTPGQVLSEGRIWISYTSTTAGATASGSVTVTAVETNESWTIPITANTVARPKSAVTLVLDHSGSMSEDAGDGLTKVSKVRQAAKTFIDAMLPGDGLGLVRFDDTADIVMAVDDVATIGGTAKTTIDGPQFNPDGATSVGDGLQKGSQALTAAPAGYTVKAMVVLTDGVENTTPNIDQVAGSITANTFAIGFGMPTNVDVGKLEMVTGSHEGYLLITGALTSDQTFRLQKYFLQILAGVTNADIVLDPGGVLSPGDVHRIPFLVTEADYGTDVILLAREPRVVDFQLETPDGTRIDPAVAATEPGVQLIVTAQVGMYRMALPALSAAPGASHAGTWHARLRAGKNPGVAGVAVQAVRGRMPYALLVHTYSALQFRARLTQASHLPGTAMTVTATLTEYEVPVAGRASVWAEMTRPDGTKKSVTMTEDEPGRFAATTTEAVLGLYVLRVRATGLTLRERPFTREQTLTASIGLGEGRAPTGGSDLCSFLECLVAEAVIRPEVLRTFGLDLKLLLECLRKHCPPTVRKG